MVDFSDGTSNDGLPDYKAVPYNQVDKSHYLTVSRRGVTRFWQGETEFFTMQQWQRETKTLK